MVFFFFPPKVITLKSESRRYLRRVKSKRTVLSHDFFRGKKRNKFPDRFLTKKSSTQTRKNQRDRHFCPFSIFARRDKLNQTLNN